MILQRSVQGIEASRVSVQICERGIRGLSAWCDDSPFAQEVMGQEVASRQRLTQFVREHLRQVGPDIPDDRAERVTEPACYLGQALIQGGLALDAMRQDLEEG